MTTFGQHWLLRYELFGFLIFLKTLCVLRYAMSSLASFVHLVLLASFISFLSSTRRGRDL
jgi:hypothetical protein